MVFRLDMELTRLIPPPLSYAESDILGEHERAQVLSFAAHICIEEAAEIPTVSLEKAQV
jgi:hypothetical protein